jgi:hypothetical protein
MEPLVPGAQPPGPPEELGPDEAIEWRLLVGRMPVDWFPPETWPLLIQLCRHICQARWFGQCLQEVRAGCMGTLPIAELENIEHLTKLHHLEGRAVQSIMLKLRLTTSVRMPDPDSARQRRAEIADELPWQTPPN